MISAEINIHPEDEPRPPLLTGPKRQHYLPRFYLDGFAKDGLVSIFDREKDEIRHQQPKDTTVIGHFYTMEDDLGRKRYEVEAMLSDYEGKAGSVIKKLAAKQDIDAEERTDFAIFIALGAMRTPDMVDSIKHMNSDLITNIAKRMYADVAVVEAQLAEDKEHAGLSAEELRAQAQLMVELAQNNGLTVETNEKWAVATAIKMSLNVAPVLAGRDWLVVHSVSDKKSFITTDAPVLLTTVAPRENNFWGIGFGNSDAMVLFPLTSSCILIMHGDSGGFRHLECDSDYVRRVNIGLAEHCQRFVIGRDQRLVASLTNHLSLATKKWLPKFRSS
ncbi:MAG: DUF4238 domain-containing protein [Azonexaceae bacterium]|nr:DUF4238 domain-containing protein [Azonexaceae bacterium]